MPLGFCDTRIGKIAVRERNGVILSIHLRAETIPLSEPMEETPLILEASRQIRLYLSGNLKTFSLPFTLEGSPFMQKVWKEVSKIPYGKTLSYGGVALRLGDKNLARAVGTACGKNPVPFLIPCHRVVGRNGTPSGDGGARKIREALLLLEKGQELPGIHPGPG